MKVFRRVIYWLIAFTVIFIIFWLGYTRKSPEPVKKNKAVLIEVEAAGTGSIEQTIELTGWIRANKVVDVTSKVPGRIESLQAKTDTGELIAVEEGLQVKKGQQLAVIDHDVYLAQLAAAEASVKAREVELADAEREKKRILALYEAGSVTEQSKDKAVTAADLAAASLSLAKANLKLAQTNLQESTITSPIDGVVTAKHIDQGNMINVGQRIVTVADMRSVKLIVAVAEKYGSDITASMPAKIRVDAYPERVFDAKVYSVYPVLDEQTHTIQVEIRIENDKLLLKPGMFARVTLVTKSKDNVIVIPRDIILGGKIDKPYVYVIENGSAHKRYVELGIIQGAMCEITEGLKAGETLVVNGMNFLSDGMSVEIVRLEEIK